MKLRDEAKKAIWIGLVCAVAYCTVYISRDILGALTPQLTAGGIFDSAQLGTLSSLFFITYAVGQLINGIIGDKIRGKYMVSLGLVLASGCLFILPSLVEVPYAPYVAYATMGFFLAMVYAPMTKMIAENMEPMLATRCNVAHSMGSYLGAPIAGWLATYLVWKPAFRVSSGILFALGVIFFLSFTVFERKGMVKYGQFQRKKEEGGSIKVLLKRQIAKWTVISMLTGVVRTAILFWLMQYITDHLHFAEKEAGNWYALGTSVIAVNSFLAVFIYQRLKENLDRTIFLFFGVAALCFLGVYFVAQPQVNLILLVLAMIFSNCASSIMWSRYCPSLRDTGMVSSATGFLDFCSYMAAAISTKLFAGAVETIGWSNLILVWFGLMCCGILVAIPWHKHKKVIE